MSIKSDLSGLILDQFAHTPTPEQQRAVEAWCNFLLSTNRDEIFLFKGYAGTGKTTLLGALVRALTRLRRPVVLLAPTGRAAKVFSSHSGHPAYTIHKKIYRQKTFSAEMVDFQSDVNPHRHTLFIVDEASMISNEGISGRVFGSGRLLDDLIHYVYAGEGCRLMLVGDAAQLPPVGETLSPALSPDALSSYGLEVREATLTDVLRQVSDSGILWNATMLRRLINSDEMDYFPRFRVQGFPDVNVLPGGELAEQIEDSYCRHGIDQTIVITRSNKHANLFNNGIRGRILQYDEELTSGDRLIVVRNNYYWLCKESEEEDDKKQEHTDFIANGDVCVVRRFRNERTLYGFRFADATLRFPDFDDMEQDVTILLDTLQSEAPALTAEQQRLLFERVCADYPEITNRRDLIKKIKQDPYFNALQVKYAYAVTCHKAQGGQWERVFVDQGYVTRDMLTPDYFRWLYTALTRATDTVYLINWPEEQLEP